MGSKRRAKPRNISAARGDRATRQARWSSVALFEGPQIGPNLVTASLDEVWKAVEAVSPDLDWASLADRVVPVFQRVRPYPSSAPEPMRVVVPPGISVGFGVDIGPAFLNVHGEMVERWGLTRDELLARALNNLDRRMTAITSDDLIQSSVGGLPLRLLQSTTGCASTYVLLPESLGRILGTEPQLLIAPMRNLLVSLPVEADRELASWLFDEVATQDPNCLAPAAFLLREGGLAVEPLGTAFGSA